MILSIIVPVYNTEDFIVNCLNSIVYQMSDDVELLFINDGTPDKAIDLLKLNIRKLDNKIQEKIKIIEQENKGLSEARNKGLDNASGQYIAFVDSDDTVIESYVQEILSCIERDSADIIDFNMKTSNDNVIRIRSNDSNLIDSTFNEGAWFSCARVVKKDIIDSSRFKSNIYYEDLAFTPSLYLRANKISYINKELYWYRMNLEGITLKRNKYADAKTLDSLEKILIDYLNLYKLHPNKYYLVLIYQTYFLLCANSCRRFDLNKYLFYRKKYNINIVNAKKVNEKNIKGLQNLKLKLFSENDFAYMLVYNAYCKLSRLLA